MAVGQTCRREQPSPDASAFGSGPVNLSGGTLVDNNVTLANNLNAIATPTNIIFTTGDGLTGNLSGGSSQTVIFSDNQTGTGATPALPNLQNFTGTVQFNLTSNFFPEVSPSTNGAGGSWIVNGSGGFLFSASASGSVLQLGSLSGNGVIGSINGGGSAAAYTIWQVGALNTSTTFSGQIVDNVFNPKGSLAALSKVGSGTLTLSGNNNYSGGTTISAGGLVLSGANVSPGNTTPAGGSLTVSNQIALLNSTLGMNVGDTGTVNFTVPAVTLGGLSGGRSLSLGSTAVTVGNNNQSTVYSGSLTGGNGLTKVGIGTLTLLGSNTYSGPTSITSGTVRLGGTLPANANIMPVGDSITNGY